MKKLLRALPFSIGLIVPAVGIYVGLHPAGGALVVLPLFLFGLIPLLDLVMGLDKGELDVDAAGAVRDWRYDLWLWAWIPLQLAALLAALHAVAGGDLSWSSFVLLALSVGLITGAGINVAHELMHRRGKLERALAELLMTTTTYTHFCVEHVHGHHKHVSTPNDPASSVKGESLYAYLPRTLVGGLRSAWRIESKRRAGLPLSLRGLLVDRRVRYPLTLAIVYAVVVVVAGPWGAVFFALQSVVAMTLLEIINYIEHYGLARRELSPGVYERCLPAHSWNASERLTNWFLFHLQRHADHHHIASRPYFALRHIEDSPQLPTGYPGMVLLALVPPLWRRVMNPRVDAWREKQFCLGLRA
jgi:alkane 1-monooxygenase